MFRMMKKTHTYLVLGEIGDLSRKDKYYIKNAVETDTQVKVYPLGTHVFLLDRKVGYVLIGYDEAVIIYERRFKSKKMNHVLQEGK